MLSRTYRRMSFYFALESIQKLTEFSNLNVQALSLLQSGIEAVCKTRGSCAEKRVFWGNRICKHQIDYIEKTNRPQS